MDIRDRCVKLGSYLKHERIYSPCGIWIIYITQRLEKLNVGHNRLCRRAKPLAEVRVNGLVRYPQFLGLRTRAVAEVAKPARDDRGIHPANHEWHTRALVDFE